MSFTVPVTTSASYSPTSEDCIGQGGTVRSTPYGTASEAEAVLDRQWCIKKRREYFAAFNGAGTTSNKPSALIGGHARLS